MYYFRCFAKESMEEIMEELEKEGTEWAMSKINVSDEFNIQVLIS